FVWEGWKVIGFKQINKADANDIENTIKETAKEFKVKRSNITYDADGVGAYLRGYLKRAKPFNNGSRAISHSKKRKVNYKNLKCQCGYEFAKIANSGQVFIECQDVPKQDLIQELECLESYKLDKGGKMQLLPKNKIKERIGKS